MTVQELLRAAAEQLAPITDRPRLEAEILLGFYLKKDRIWLHSHPNESVKSDGFSDLVVRRTAHEPVEYITGEAGFYGEYFNTSKGVLIPRPETELLIDEAAAMIRDIPAPLIAEIGTGSGVISIILARLFPAATVIATDINPRALELARSNAAKLGVAERIRFVQTSLLDKVEGDFDPPYIAESYDLPLPVRHEPREALFSGRDGGDLLRAIIDLAARREIPRLCCEMGYDQQAILKPRLEDAGFCHYRFYKDYAGHDRGFSAETTR